MRSLRFLLTWVVVVLTACSAELAALDYAIAQGRNWQQQRYIAVIQPYLARVYRFGNQLMPRLITIARLQPQAGDFQQYLTGLQQLKQHFEQANQRHVRAWQALLNECGAMPDGRRNKQDL